MIKNKSSYLKHLEYVPTSNSELQKWDRSIAFVRGIKWTLPLIVKGHPGGEGVLSEAAGRIRTKPEQAIIFLW